MNRHPTKGHGYHMAAAALCGLLGFPVLLAAEGDCALVDLGPRWNANLKSHFAAIETGTVNLAGVPFQVTPKRVRVGPGSSLSIELPQTACAGIHVLHYLENSGIDIGSYVIGFVDGQSLSVPITCGLNIHDWWKPQPLPYAPMAHQDVFTWQEKKQPVAFWRFSIRNPRPRSPVRSLQILNTHRRASINVIAVSLSPQLGPTVAGAPVFDPTATQEQRLVDVLRFKTAGVAKGEACEGLKRTGTAESVAALEPLLADPRWSHAARFALESMPYEQATAALRRSLAKASGKAKVGVVESLGERRDAKAVALLAPLLSDADPQLASAAATALGKIGGQDAIHALTAAKTTAQEPVGERVKDALLLAADRLIGSDKRAAAVIYRKLYAKGEPAHVRAAAYRGMILTGGKDGIDLVTAALVGSDRPAHVAALPFVRDMEGRDATLAFAALLDKVPVQTQIALIGSLAQRRDPAAGPALAKMTASAHRGVRAAAFGALALCGDASTVHALAKAAATAQGSEREAAMAALVRLPGPGVDDAVRAQLQRSAPEEAAVLARVLGERRSTSSVPVLLELTANRATPVRLAAVRSLGEVAGVEALGKLVEIMTKAKAQGVRAAAERAVVSVARRAGESPRVAEAILAGMEQPDPATRCALLRACGKLKHAQLLEALVTATKDPDASVRDAAVRAMAGSPDPRAAPCLLAIAKQGATPAHRVLALRGFARLIQEPSSLSNAERARLLREAMAATDRPSEKKLILAGLARVPTLDALTFVSGLADDPAVAAEAAAAWVAIAKPLLDGHRDDVLASGKSLLEGLTRDAMHEAAQREVAAILRSIPPAPAPAERIRFEKIVVDKQFRSEGVAVADVNNDGRNDILAGDVWYAAPDWQMHEIRAPGKYNPDRGYSQCFANFASDVDRDGWTDSIVIGFPAAAAYWYKNPGKAQGHWEPRPVAHSACGETPLFTDLLGNGKPALVFGIDGKLSWVRAPASGDPHWTIYPLSAATPAAEKFAHGLGVGDVNADGRPDVVATSGWWEAPEDRTRPDWTFHKARLGPACANMIVFDVDGDGDNDIVTSSAHKYGVWWFEQVQENGRAAFRQHEIHKGISQTHALILADVNSDGLADLVTGKRYHAHNGKDPGSAEPAMLCWFELRRPGKGKCEFHLHEIDRDSGVGTQFEVCDLDRDGLLDVVTSNKKGVYAFVQRRNE